MNREQVRDLEDLSIVGLKTKIISTGSSTATPTPLTEPCEFNSCPSGSPAEGSDSSNDRLNYVNSYPVNSVEYGIQTLSPKFFGGNPDIAVAGFNVGGKLILDRPTPLRRC